MNCFNDRQPFFHRRKYQNIFLRWLAIKRHQFLIEPLKPIVKVNCIELKFPGMTEMLEVFIRDTSLLVSVSWRRPRAGGLFIDEILDLDVAPQWCESGLYCRFCADYDPNTRYYSDLDSLLESHQFDAFLAWCNEKLFTSKWLEIYVSDGFTSSARVVKEIRKEQSTKYEICSSEYDASMIRFPLAKQPCIIYLPLFHGKDVT